MESETYRRMASHEAAHWWFVGRRRVIGAMIDRVAPPAGAHILEAGCGTGGNLYFLQRYGRVSAFEPNGEAREFAKTRAPEAVVRHGELPFSAPFEAGLFDLVLALDVLEHVDDDVAALRALVRLAKPGAVVILTVPAHSALWGSHDRHLRHVRRYDLPRLRRVCGEAGATVEYLTAFNFLLAAPAVALRLAERVGVSSWDQERMPPRWLNAIMARIFAAEAILIRRCTIPLGLSFGVILRVPDAART